jgi:hypothetical protein
MAQLPWRVAADGLSTIAGVESRRLTADFNCDGILRQRKQFGADVLHMAYAELPLAHSRVVLHHPHPWVVLYGYERDRRSHMASLKPYWGGQI